MKRIFITIYILMLGTMFIIPFGLGPVIDEFFRDEVVKAERDISRGTFSLIAERLAHLDTEARQEELSALQPRFGYPLGLLSLDDVDVAERLRRDLMAGLIVPTQEDDILLLRLGETDDVLAMGGPFPGEDLDFKATVLFLFMFVLLLTIPALAWSFFIYRDIRKVERTTTQFASGDHDARVAVSRISSMGGIADTFNTMAEKTQKLIASQKDLANSVSHEIRTPLARIKFSLEMASDTLDTGGTDYIQEIGKDVEEIEALVDEMLTYARFEREPESSGRLSNHEMVSWLSALVGQEKKTAVGKTLAFEPATDHFIARFEPVYLGWAVRNLLRNGLKHGNEKVALVFEPGQARVCIHVDDDGPGIPEEARNKIFEPFFRLDQSRSRASGGYGLGLAIAKRIITWHRGSVAVTTSPFGGARFTLDLPRDLTEISSQESV